MNALPFPARNDQDLKTLAQLAEQAYKATQSIQCLSETDHEFCIPFFINSETESIVDLTRQKLSITYRQLEAKIDEIDELVADLLGLTNSEREQVARETASRPTVCPFENQNLVELEGNAAPLISSVFSYLVGTTFGRWDIRYATSERQPSVLPDPFAPLPVCPSGMLQNPVGLPAKPKDVPTDYPLRISWAGILVDDENHPENIVGRVRKSIEIIFKDCAESIEQKACDFLGVTSLRDYFRHLANFFDDHLKRYSKSRRQAPIYWPLSTQSGSYTLWLYYHRLTDQTLYACVNEFIDHKNYGKLTQVTEELKRLRAKSNRSSSEEKELERLSDLELELRDFRDELLRIARFWKPNLNDGVQITAAPLWNLFQHRQWKVRLKETWEKLEAGDYDWAHLALSIWPDRVVRASHKDHSYAIAHDLEDQLWHKVEVEKVGRGSRVTTTTEWRPRDLSSTDLQRIIAEVKAR